MLYFIYLFIIEQGLKWDLYNKKLLFYWIYDLQLKDK